jgi:hypothetical protein
MIDKDLPQEKGSVQILFGDKIIYQGKNRIVGSSRSVKASSIIGGPSADYISSLRLGRTGAIQPPPVFENEKSLVNNIYEIPLGYDIDPRPYIEDDPLGRALSSVITWTGIVPVDIALTFDEAGLFSLNGYMWSRATFPVVTKPIGTTMSFRWKIEL